MTSQRPPRLLARRIPRALFVAFLTYHAASILTSLVPTPSTLSDKITPLFATYRILTGVRPSWNMFTSVPYRQSSEVRVWSLDALGVSRDHGPILPGLRDYDAAKTFRHHSAFDRFTTPRFEAYLPPYACRVADLVESERGQRPVQIQVVMTAKRIRFLNEIRAGGGTTFDQVWSSEPFEVADCID